MIVHGTRIAEFPGSHAWLKGINCGFSTLQAGNMSHEFGMREEVLKNRSCFYKEIGLSYSRRAVMLPEHEDGVGLVSGPGEVRGDALVTSVPGLTLHLCLADSLPIIITNNNQQEKILALVHAGLAGTKKRILEKVLRVLNNLGFDGDRLVVAIGPGIHTCCYGADLVGENIRQAEEGGIPTNHIVVADDCTSCNRRRSGEYLLFYHQFLFFSHQRSKKTGEEEGRFIAAVAIAEAGR